MSKIGPNGRKFLDAALPGNEGGHVLAVGEYHALTGRQDWINQHLPELVAQRRLGAIGLEMRPFMNVFAWAYRDGNLPVSKAKAADYMRSIFRSLAARPDFKDNLDRKALLSMHALDKGVDVMAFDGRDTLAEKETEFSDEINLLRDIFRKMPKMAQSLHANPSMLDKSLESNYLRFGYTLMEVESLLKKHPEYKERLDALEKVILDGRAAGISADAISATLLAASIRPGKNAITVMGEDHIAGIKDDGHNTQGTFHENLESQGFKVTPAIVTTLGNLERALIPINSPGGPGYEGSQSGGLAYERLQSHCDVRADMNLYVTDTDKVLLNLSKLPTQTQLPGSIGDELVKKGVVFSCTDPALPTASQKYPGDKLNPLLNPDVKADAAKIQHLLQPRDTPVPPLPDAPRQPQQK